MKKCILLLLMVLGTVTMFAQQPDTVVTIPGESGGFWGFYNKYSEAIWIVLAATGASVFFWNRSRLLKDAVDKLLAAGDDTSPEGRRVSQEEWNGIIAAFKAIFSKQKKD